MKCRCGADNFKSILTKEERVLLKADIKYCDNCGRAYKDNKSSRVWYEVVSSIETKKKNNKSVEINITADYNLNKTKKKDAYNVQSKDSKKKF